MESLGEISPTKNSDFQDAWLPVLEHLGSDYWSNFTPTTLTGHSRSGQDRPRLDVARNHILSLYRYQRGNPRKHGQRDVYGFNDIGGGHLPQCHRTNWANTLLQNKIRFEQEHTHDKLSGSTRYRLIILI